MFLSSKLACYMLSRFQCVGQNQSFSSLGWDQFHTQNFQGGTSKKHLYVIYCHLLSCPAFLDLSFLSATAENFSKGINMLFSDGKSLFFWFNDDSSKCATYLSLVLSPKMIFSNKVYVFIHGSEKRRMGCQDSLTLAF